MATTKKKTSKRAAPKTTKKPTKSKFTLDDAPEAPTPGGGGLQFPKATARNRPPKKRGGAIEGYISIKHPAGNEEVVDSIRGVIALAHPMRSMTASKFDPDNPKPPDCMSVDGINGQVRAESVDQLKAMGAMPTGKCMDCPWNTPAAPYRCNIYRQLYVIREGDDTPTMVALPRSADRGTKVSKENTYQSVMVGQVAKDHTVVLWSEPRFKEDGSPYSSFHIKLDGESPLDDEVIAQTRETIGDPGVLLLPAGPDMKQLTEGTSASDESWD